MTVYAMWITISLSVCITAYILMQKFFNRVTRLSDVASITALLAPPDCTLEELLLARALPNVRLKQVFGIRNTFVDPSPAVHRAFVREAAALLDHATPGGDWNSLRGIVIDAVDRCLPDGTVNFAPFVQAVTFATIAGAMFDVDPAHLDPADVALVTGGINELWCLSKARTPPPPLLLQQIDVRLRHWMPHVSRNPLDLLLPAYETMWRVVAVALAHTLDQPQHRGAFAAFLADPSGAQFYAPGGGGSASAACVIAETLRLHPPTKRIARAFSPGALPRMLRACLPRRVRAADVEALHRAAVWGPAPDAFDARRHLPGHLAPAQRDALLPFGAGRLRCVAHRWAPRAAALLVAGILARAECEITKGGAIGGREGWDGWVVTRA